MLSYISIKRKYGTNHHYMKSIAIIIPFYGKTPKLLPLWAKTAYQNPTIDFFIFTDLNTFDFVNKSNVHVIKLQLKDIKSRTTKIIGFEAVLNQPYKLCDYKPLYGLIFKEEIAGFDFWGHSDISDQLFGDLRSFIPEDKLKQNDKLFVFGHLVLYRNTTDVNTRPLLPCKDGTWIGFPLVFKTDVITYYDEKGIPALYKFYGFKYFNGDDSIADIWPGKFLFHSTHGKLTDKSFLGLLKNGKAYALSLSERGVIFEEVAYLHFQKRQMMCSTSVEQDSWLIVPNQCIPISDFVNDDLKCYFAMRENIFYEFKYWIKYELKRLPDKIKYKRILKLSKKAKL